MDAYVRDGNYVLRVDLPGVDPKDLDINVEGRLLTIKENGNSRRRTTTIGRRSTASSSAR